MADSIGVVIPCHNDAEYLPRVLTSVLESLRGWDSRVILVADRCTDGSAEVASRYCEVRVKTETRWRNTIPENNNIALEEMIGMRYLSVVDSDMVVPKEFFSKAVGRLRSDPSLASVSSALYTEPSTTYNSLYFAYETLLDRVGLSRRNKKHGHRVYRGELLKRLYDRRGYVFRDVLGEDPALDLEIGKAGVMTDVVVWHVRKTSLSKSLRAEVRQGMAAREMGTPYSSVVKELVRLRPVVPLAYWLRSDGGARRQGARPR